MLVTITATHNPATDLGYLLHKNLDIFSARKTVTPN
jgi:phosphomannomutase